MATYLTILAISLLVLYVYSGFRGRNRYFSGRGILLFFLLLALMCLKIRGMGIGTHIIRPSAMSFLINLLVTTLGAIMLWVLKKKNRRMSIPDALLLFLLYIPFALIEQLLFLFVFSETLYAITGNVVISAVLSSIYFQEFHPNKLLGKYVYLMYAIALLWTITYLVYGNIFWPSLSLAVLGPIYYYFLFGKSRFRIGDLFEK